MTIKTLIKNYAPKLKGKSSSPILDTELLIGRTLNKPKEYLYTYPEKKLTANQIERFEKYFQRRLQSEPIAYILGHLEFYSLKFKVNPNVLIPRPETEILVEQVLKFSKQLAIRHKPFTICDIGVGSGAIIISLAKNIKNANFYGTDISPKALKLARQNAKTHKAKIKFLAGNLLKPIQNLQLAIHNLIITANLPYLDQKQENLLASSDAKSLLYEPQIAWDGGIDGLDYYQEFFQQIKDYKIKPLAIFLEIGHQQTSQIKRLAKEVLANYKVKIIKDLCGHDRIVIITANNKTSS